MSSTQFIKESMISVKNTNMDSSFLYNNFYEMYKTDMKKQR
jgi:hypothetical protein